MGVSPLATVVVRLYMGVFPLYCKDLYGSVSPGNSAIKV